MAVSSCALPQDAERLIVQRGRAEVVIGARYAGHETNPVDEVRVELVQAPEFELRMPDGVWLTRGEITYANMLRHGARADSDTIASFGAPQPEGSMDGLSGRHAFVMFAIGAHDNTPSLRISACGRSFPQLLRSKSGEVFGFPLSVDQFGRLFGPVTRRERFGILTGLSCL